MSDWDGETTAHAAEGPQWVSAAEAADVAGVTPGTVRYWARNGLIVSEVVRGPAGERTLVRLDEVLQHARQGSPAGPGPGGGGAETSPGGGQVVTDLPARTSELAPILKSIPEIMAQLTAATDRAARAETKVEFLSAQVTELRRRLAEAEAGGAAAADPVVPPGWEASARTEPAREETPGTKGWPAPPPEASPAAPDYGAATSDPPAAVSERAWASSDRAAGSIDWGAGTAEEEEGRSGTAATATPAASSSPDISLRDIWADPSSADPSPAAPAAAPSDEVEWHEPSWGTTEAQPDPEPEPPRPPARPANANIPDDGFYGPRRRRSRWFRRRSR